MTARHSFWSVDRQAWVPLSELQRGERLSAWNGSTPVLEAVSLREQPEPVFNLEVEGIIATGPGSRACSYILHRHVILSHIHVGTILDGWMFKVTHDMLEQPAHEILYPRTQLDLGMRQVGRVHPTLQFVVQILVCVELRRVTGQIGQVQTVAMSRHPRCYLGRLMRPQLVHNQEYLARRIPQQTLQIGQSASGSDGSSSTVVGQGIESAVGIGRPPTANGFAGGAQKVGEFGLGKAQLTTAYGSQAEGFEDFIGEFAGIG